MQRRTRKQPDKKSSKAVEPKAKAGRPKGSKTKRKDEDYLIIPLEARGLTDKQRRFCEEYIIDLNATQAAIRAGYSPKAAPTTGSVQTDNRKCIKYINYLKIQRAKRLEVSQNRIVEELARIAYHDKRTFYDKENNAIPLTQITDEQQTAIRDISFKEITVDAAVEQIDGEMKIEKVKKRIVSKYNLHSRVDALRMLGHHMGMSLDKPSEKPIQKQDEEAATFESVIRNLEVEDLEKFAALVEKAEKAKSIPREPKPKTIEQELMEEDRELAIPQDHWSNKAGDLMQ